MTAPRTRLEAQLALLVQAAPPRHRESLPHADLIFLTPEDRNRLERLLNA